MRHTKTNRFLFFAMALLFALSSFSCNFWKQTNRNANTTTTEPREAIKEPEKYQASLIVYLDKGDDAISTTTPLLLVKVARDKLSRRYHFNFNNQEVIYIEGANQNAQTKRPESFNYLIVPECKQYSDVRLEQMGFRFPSSVSPQEIIESLQNQNSLEAVGEESINGRPAIKYRYTDARTGENYVFIDKETKMPLRAKIAAEVLDPQTPPDDPTGQRRVLRLLVDVKDIVMNADPAAFQEPQGMERVMPNKLCPKVKEQATAAVKTLWDLSANTK